MMKKAVILLIVLVLLSLQTPIYAAKKTSAKQTVQSVSSNTTINYAKLAKKVFYGKNDTVYVYVKAVDIDGDMALLSIKTSKAVPFLKLSGTLPEQGEEIMAVGNPKILEGTISNGIVSAFRDNNRWIQFTAPVSEGSSGGALINSAGEVVGMQTLLFS